MKCRFAVGLTCLAVLVSPIATSGQMTLGLGGGLESSTFGGLAATHLYGSVAAEKRSRTGFNFGASLSIPLDRRVGVVTGVNYVQKGAVWNETTQEVRLKINYLQIPLVISLTMTPADSPVAFGVFGGPTVSFQMSCDREIDVPAASSSSVSCDDDGQAKSDFGGMVGARAAVPLTGRFSLGVSGGFDAGLKRIGAGEPRPDLKNFAFFARGEVGIQIG